MIAADSREPVRKARVDLIPSVGERLDPIYADTDGRFEFTAVTGGRYTLSAWKSGFAPTTLGARTFWEPAAVIALDAGQSLEGFEIALNKGAAIAGRVVDDAGEPVTDMTVSVGRAAPVNGRLQFQAVGRFATTDDRGEYRIGGLAPGAYVVNVVGRAGPSIPMPGTDPGFRVRSVFYPQTPFLTQARPVGLRAGEEASSIDVAFTLDSLVTPTVSGRVVDPRGLAVQAGVLATSSGDGVSAAVGGQPTTVQESGEFSMRLVPGDYTLTAQTDGMVAMTRLTVDRTDITGVELVLARGATVAGRVVFEGTARRPSALEVTARPPDRAVFQLPGLTSRPARVRGDGSFTLSNLIGIVEIRVAPEARGWRPTSIIAGGRNILDVPVDFKGGENLRDVVILMTERTASLTGTLIGSPEKSTVWSVSVLLFPSDPRQAPRRARWVRPDQLGRFFVDDLSPGDYLVASTTNVDDLLWQTPAFFDQFRDGATRVTIGDGETKSIALEWPVPR